jgi:hypothetical protein
MGASMPRFHWSRMNLSNLSKKQQGHGNLWGKSLLPQLKPKSRPLASEDRFTS